MWASDYPHTDGVWPEHRPVHPRDSSVTCRTDVVHKITCENAGKFYGLMT